MIKSLIFVFSSFFVGSSSIITLPEVSTISSQVIDSKKDGIESISEIRTSFEAGEYDSFLKEMDDSYQQAKEANQLEPLAEMRLGFIPEAEEWETQIEKIKEERGEALLNAVKDQSTGSFITKVQNAAANLSNDEQKKVIMRMVDLRQMIPGSGKTSDENQLIDLDLEYQYKALHLDLPGADTIQKREKHAVLKMDKIKKMNKISAKSQDEALKKDVALYSENFDARLSQSWDLADLSALANGRVKSTNLIQEKIASTMNLYQEKLSDLAKQFLAEHKN